MSAQKSVSADNSQPQALLIFIFYVDEVCGISVASYNSSTDQEFIGYRQKLLSITKEVVQFREKGGKRALAAYFYPAQLEGADTYQKDMENSLKGG